MFSPPGSGPHFAIRHHPRVARSRRGRTPWASSPGGAHGEFFTMEKPGEMVGYWKMWLIMINHG